MRRTPIAIATLLVVIAIASLMVFDLPNRLSSPQHRVSEKRSQKPRPKDDTRIPTQLGATQQPVRSAIRFDEARIGIDFQYFNSNEPATPGARMFEFIGGGVGVIDFDLDGRPDLYFTQGCRWPPDPSQTEHLDRLYRNHGRGFVDVTAVTGLVESGFSQGVACGDFDDDGFQDVYVANIGANRLFRNRGDGTFSEIETGAGSVSGDWTTSVVIADLNGDSLPDLFDVNYVTGPDVFDRICDHDGSARVCSPTAFDAQPDRLWLNRGDGTFADVTRLVGLEASGGTGLGVNAADFDGSGRLSLFVANDARPNHFFRNVPGANGELPRFEESGARYGLATDRDGSSQACMGVAAGDADGDGRLDLFVTNYVDESNTLYQQRSDGTFADVSRESGLTRPSVDLLGFGTQFLDADCDGREDLVVTNGHVDDFRFKGYAYAMPAQIFRNTGHGFEELPASVTGEFFESKRRGRGLARLDWNRDRRVDFAVSHLDEPAALLTNATTGTGHAAAFRLRATRSARDAIGTVIEVAAGDAKWIRQLTAGDGYQASNERTLIVGLGDAGRKASVTVYWPSGQVDRFQDLAADAEWMIIEGRGRPFRVAN